MASDSIACRILIQNELLEHDGGYVSVPWVPDYRRRWLYDGIPYQVKQRAGDRGITAEDMEKSQHTDFNEDAPLKWKVLKRFAGFMDSKENKWVSS